MDQSVSPPPDEQADETEFATVASAVTVDAAKKKALEQLRKVVPYVREEDVEFVVVDEGGQGGFLGMGKSQPRVEARVLPGANEAVGGDVVDADEALQKLDDFVTRVTTGMGLDVDVEVSQAGDAVVADIAGGDLGLLIGRHGQTLDALQYLAAIVVNGHAHARRQVIVDAEGYRNRREVSLRAVAERAAQKVERTHGELVLKPMTAAERKIVHLHLKDHPNVETRSEGDEPQRSVIVSPRRPSLERPVKSGAPAADTTRCRYLKDLVARRPCGRVRVRGPAGTIPSVDEKERSRAQSPCSRQRPPWCLPSCSSRRWPLRAVGRLRRRGAPAPPRRGA